MTQEWAGSHSRAFVFSLLIAANVLRGGSEYRLEFNSDPKSPELMELAKPLVVDESKYGCGPLLKPGRTYYVSREGSDEADGLSLRTAWRHVAHGLSRLRPGDSLLIAEGEYVEPNLDDKLLGRLKGEPGRPITIAAVPRHRVEVFPGTIGSLEKAPGTDACWCADADFQLKKAALWEMDTFWILAPVGSLDRADAIPGSYYLDEEAHRLHVHFTDSRGPDVHRLAASRGERGSKHLLRSLQRGGARRPGLGLDITGSYLHIKGIWFKHWRTGAAIRPAKQAQAGKAAEGGHHITIEDCAFFATEFAGLVLLQGAQWNLVRDCYGARNGGRGSILFLNGSRDNLIMGNRLDPSPRMLRRGGDQYHFGVSSYGTTPGTGNYILDNVMTGQLGYRCKSYTPGCTVQGNVMPGWAQINATVKGEGFAPEDRFIFKNNTVLGRTGHNSVRILNSPTGPGGAGGNWSDRFKALTNNFVALDTKSDQKDGNRSIAEARFADLAYADCRVQSDSPLRGRALGGGDVGAFRRLDGQRVLYVGPSGDDRTTGTAISCAWQTLSHASQQLRAGDTLYVMPGHYEEPLEIAASGTEDRAIAVRAHGRGKVVLSRDVRVRGSHISLEYLTLTAPAEITGAGVTLDHCVVHDCQAAAGVLIDGPRAALRHCTIVDNDIGIALTGRGTDASVRDSIIAFSRRACLKAAPGTETSLLVSHTCWHGEGADAALASSTRGCVVGDPGFVDREQRDWRVAWDGPAAGAAPFARAAGACPAAPRPLRVAAVKVRGLSDRATIIEWQTPGSDSTGVVIRRLKGSTSEGKYASPFRGGRHAACVVGFAPGRTYEYQIQVRDRDGSTHKTAWQDLEHEPVAAAARTLYVSTDGGDGGDGLTRATAWRTMRKACIEAGPGDTVLFQPGIYHGQFLPLRGGARDARLTFRADGGEVVIDGGEVLAPFVQMRSKPYVTFDGLTFANAPREGGFGALFQIRTCPGTEILNCRVGRGRPEGGYGQCFYITSSPDSRIEGNVVWGTRYHVICSHNKNLLIKNNTFARGQVFSVHIYGPHEGVRVVNNIFNYPTSVPNAAIACSWPSRDIGFTSDYNLFGPAVQGTHVAYVYSGSVLNRLISGADLGEWRKNSGQGEHSLQTNPLLVDPRRGDFRLRADSPGAGSGECGVNMGACPAERILVKGARYLPPGAGRTLRLTAVMRDAAGPVTFRWSLPDGSTRTGPELTYSPPQDQARQTFKVTATDSDGATASARVPTGVPPVWLADFEEAVKVEAEDFVAEGQGKCRILGVFFNASGAGVAGWGGDTGHWLEWEIDVPQDGRYELVVRHAAKYDPARKALTIDGKSPGPAFDDIRIPPSGGWAVSADWWRFHSLGSAIPLTAGKHRLRMASLEGAFNTDYFLIIRRGD